MNRDHIPKNLRLVDLLESAANDHIYINLRSYSLD